MISTITLGDMIALKNTYKIHSMITFIRFEYDGNPSEPCKGEFPLRT